MILSRGPGAISIDYVIERAFVTGAPQLWLLAVGLVASAAAVALWYFAYNDQAHAGLTCLFIVGPDCSALIGLSPLAPYLPRSPIFIWASLVFLLVSVGWVLFGRKDRPLIQRSSGA